MGDKSSIEWTDATWNPITGCTKVSAGCKHCYVERDWARLSANPKTVYYGRPFTTVQYHHERLGQPLQWKKPRRIFVNSMSDLFHNEVNLAEISRVFYVMQTADWHQYQVLTKRAKRMRYAITALLNHSLIKTPPAHLWLGVSVEDQDTANERIQDLLHTPATVRFLSIEPLLGPVKLPWLLDETGRRQIGAQPGIRWVIVGGESGPNARPMDPDWARSLRDQCKAAGVAFFMKQMARKTPIPDDLMIRQWPEVVRVDES